MAALTQAQRTARTRASVLSVAAQRFFRDGYHGTSLDDVARDAGYTKGAVYATFKSKGGLFLALCEIVFDERLEHVRAMAAMEPGDRLDALGRQPVDPRNEAWLLLCIEFWVHSARQPEHLAAFAEIYRRLREKLSDLAPDNPGPLGKEHWAIVTLALGNGLALERLIDPDGVPHDLMADALRLLMQHPSLPNPDGAGHEEEQS